MYLDEIKKILTIKLKEPLTVTGINIILSVNGCEISKPQLFILLIRLSLEGFLLKEINRDLHPKRKPIYLFSLNKKQD